MQYQPGLLEGFLAKPRLDLTPSSNFHNEVIDHPDDPLRTFPTSDPNVRRVEFGEAGLITHLISDGARLVIILDIPRAGGIRRGQLG